MTFNTFAQVANFTEAKSEKAETCSPVPFEMPATIKGNPEAFNNFIKVMSLPSGARQQAFSALSNEDKANVFKVKLALEFVKRPNMTNAQKGLILDTILSVSADTYDKNDPQKVAQTERNTKILESNALRLFPQNEAFDIFADMNGDKTFENNLLAKYENLLKYGMKSRKRFAKEIPLAERLNLWNIQLVFHLATSSLNKQQSEYIVDLMPQIPTIIEASKKLTGAEREKYLQTLESSMFAVFGKEMAYAIFMEIGIHKKVLDQSDMPVMFLNTSIKSNIWNSLNSKYSNVQWSCDCRWYCSSGSCKGIICKTTTNCGPFNEWDCTNLCKADTKD